MLQVAEDYGFAFDAVQMPLNVMDAHYRSFEKEVLPELVRLKTGVLAMKSMANGILLRSNTVTPIECLHYALNLPTYVVITGEERGYEEKSWYGSVGIGEFCQRMLKHADRS